MTAFACRFNAPTAPPPNPPTPPSPPSARPSNAAPAQPQARPAALLAPLATLPALHERPAAASARAQAQFDQRGQLLPRQRVALLLDAGAPWLPLAALAGYLQDI